MELPAAVDIAIIGAGPAGMLAAIAATGSGRRVLIFERMSEAGKKILATGGGRCNVTNLDSIEEYTANFDKSTARFITPALYAFTSEDLINFMAEIGLKTFSPDNNRIYPESEKARDVRDILRDHCKKIGVTFFCDCPVSEIITGDNQVCGIKINDKIIQAKSIIVASGGQSMPELGSDGSGFNLLRKCGHTIIPPVPALSGLVINLDWVRELAGTAVDNAKLIFKRDSEKKPIELTGSILFTHKGISGPAALNMSGKISRALAEGDNFSLQLICTPAINWKEQLKKWRDKNGKAQILSLLSTVLPKRLATAIIKLSGGAPEQTVATIAADVQKALIQNLSAIELPVKSTEGFSNSMVTNGGVTLSEIDRQTMQSRKITGLYLAGEVIDVDGPCGGYNLQWAFSSGHLAGKAAAK